MYISCFAQSNLNFKRLKNKKVITKIKSGKIELPKSKP